MKFRTIKTLPRKANITLEDAINAARAAKAIFSNRSRDLSDDEKAALLKKKGIINIPKSVGGSALKQSHSKPTAKAKTKRRLTISQRATTKSVSARKK